MYNEQADEIIQKLRANGCYVSICYGPQNNDFVRIKLEFFLENDWYPHHIQSENTDILLALQEVEKQYDEYSVK